MKATANRGVMSIVEGRSLKGRLVLGLFFAILVLTGIIIIFPFFFSFTAGLKNSTEIYRPGVNLWPASPDWGNYVEAWRRFNMTRMFWNTFVVAGGGVLAQLVVSSLAAFFLSRLKPIGSNLVMVLILITMTIPRIAYLVPLYMTLAKLPFINTSLINTFWGLWLPYAVNPFMILVLKNAFDSIPRQIYDAAEVDGATETRIFLQFTIPLSASIMLVLGLLSFIGLWGDFLLPLLVLRDSSMQTVSVRLFNLTRDFPMNLHMAGSFIAMIPPMFAAIFLQRYMKGGLTF
ncbi:MAG: carbohydrate ABC transporter permease [Anaerolineales bacterium]|nr:carbohydrate ABC transporter permease [Anaerolineales bacterium]